MNKTRSAKRFFGVMLVTMCCALPTWAGTIFSDDFQNYTGGTSLTQLTRIGDLNPTWQVVQGGGVGTPYTGNVDVVGIGTFAGLCAATGEQCVDLAGSGTSPNGIPTGAFLQTVNLFNFLANTTYYVQFSLAGSLRGYPDNFVSYGLRDGSGTLVAGGSLTVIANAPFAFVSFNLAPSASDRQLRLFIDNSTNVGATPWGGNPAENPGYYGALLDNVLITDVPEPGTFGLLGLAALAGGLLYRRRRA